jgi:hypothetical protein
MLLRIYHAAIWGNGAWTVKRKESSIDKLFVKKQIANEEDDDE